MNKGVLTVDKRYPNDAQPDLEIESILDEAIQKLADKLGLDVVHGPINACPTCEHFTCVCDVMAQHEPDCKYRRAVCCSVAIECDHGYDVCTECDPCTCSVYKRLDKPIISLYSRI